MKSFFKNLAKYIPKIWISKMIFLVAIIIITYVLFNIVFTIPAVQIIKTTEENATEENVIEENVSEENVTHSKSFQLTRTKMNSRRKLLKTQCKEFGLDDPRNNRFANTREFLYNEPHRLLWCNVFKAASTSWLYNFNLLAGYTPEFMEKATDDALRLAQKKYKKLSLTQLKEAFRKSTSFLIVRHPLDRLLSAYRDKVQKIRPYYKSLRHEIIRKFRKNYGDLKDDDAPTFPEFVNYVLQNNLNEHWAPIVQFCSPCLFDFEIIAHTETLQEDQEYIISKAHIEGLVSPKWMNNGELRTKNDVAEYYSQLTTNQILQLYQFYRYDFLLFDYTLKGYIEYGNPDE